VPGSGHTQNVTQKSSQVTTSKQPLLFLVLEKPVSVQSIIQRNWCNRLLTHVFVKVLMICTVAPVTLVVLMTISAVIPIVLIIVA